MLNKTMNASIIFQVTIGQMDLQHHIRGQIDLVTVCLAGLEVFGIRTKWAHKDRLVSTGNIATTTGITG